MALRRVENEVEIYDGILNDWDMASHLDATSQVPRSAAAHRTGTLPFMAIELLKEGDLVQNTPRHMYRHDLESFFYILLWACLYYDLDNGQVVVPEDDKCGAWRSDKTEQVRSFKSLLFHGDNDFAEKVIPYLRPEWKHVGATWLIPLYEYIRDARMSAPVKRRLIIDLPGTPASSTSSQTEGDYENPKLDGLITYERFLGAIGEKPYK
jgi:Fungal protein kinase